MLDVTKTAIRTWARLGQRGTFCGVALPDIAKNKDNLYVLSADLTQLSGLDRFVTLHPENYYNVGIAEQNLIGIASGLAMEGNCVFATTYASFIAIRSLEQVRQNVAYQNTNVKVIGSASGVLSGLAGISHWATEDLNAMRALPNMVVLSPADATEACKTAYAAAEYEGPMYIRLSGALNCPIVYDEDYKFEIGKGITLLEGVDVAIIATGLIVSESLKAAEILQKHGITATVVNMHTINPLDKKLLEKIFKTHNLIVTVEEHNVIGGLGSAVAEFKSTFTAAPRQIFLGITNFDKTGSQRYIWNNQGITADKIAERILSEVT